jgi:MFS family permease
MRGVSDELDRRRWWALPILLVGSFLSFLDFFVVNIALPAIRDDLRARASELQLVVAGYGIGFAVSLITGGRLGDIGFRPSRLAWSFRWCSSPAWACSLSF